MLLNSNEKEMVKRLVPFTAVGGFVCSYCIIEKSKNIIGLEMPDILTLPDHDELEEMMDQNEADNLAITCIEALVKKMGLKEEDLNFCRASSLQNMGEFGSLFVGLRITNIKPDETLNELRSRVAENFHKIGLFGSEFDGGGPEESTIEKDTQMHIIEDVMFFYTEKQDEEDYDDYDEGSAEGFAEGTTFEHELAKIAIYRILKAKKVKDIILLLEDFNSTMYNLKDDMGFLKRWTKKYNEEIAEDE